MEVGMSMKEPPQPQSRLSQWTHPNSIESLSGSSSPLEPNLGKHGEKNINNLGDQKATAPEQLTLHKTFQFQVFKVFPTKWIISM